jgi:D-serine deaminase-like pyridoxal phosphate-dependent protein
MDKKWWDINPETLVDTPFLAVYEDRIQLNIERLIKSVDGDVQKLRPHIKTHKIGEILELFKKYNINKVKCATIAEAELCAIHQIPDILLAYQPIGLKKERWISLIQKYPVLSFSTIVDNIDSARELNDAAQKNNCILKVYVDLNVGMNRTGFRFSDDWTSLIQHIGLLHNLRLLGVHIYDGHLKGSVEERIDDASKAFTVIKEKIEAFQKQFNSELKIVAGGSNTFPFYSNQKNVECSPGTFVFWDANYKTNLPEQEFEPAAVLVGSVISKPTEDTFCIDIGYKAVSSENPINKRVVILNDENLFALSHSEEHLIVENRGENQYTIGDLIYALPYHVCPTCALYDSVQVVNSQHQIYDEWRVAARSRKINI